MDEDGRTYTMYEACLLHSRADRALRVVVSRQLERFNVTMMEWLLLGVVEHGPKEGSTMSVVAGTLDVTLPQVTALTASLIKAKLLKQRVSRQDRRSRRLISTSTGRRLQADIEKNVKEAMKDWTGNIPPDQLNVYFHTAELLANRKAEQAAAAET